LKSAQFDRLVALVRRRGGDVQRGRPWRLSLQDRVLLVATYWRTNLTLRQVAPLFGISKSAADRILDHLAPLLAISPARRKREDTVYSVDGTLVPTRDRTIAASSRNYRYSTDLQVVVDANSRLVVAIGDPLPGGRNDCRAFSGSGVDRACRGVPPSPTAATRAPDCSSRTATARPGASESAAGGRERRPPPGPGACRARPVPPEELEGPAGLPAQRERRSPGHARRRTPRQHGPQQITLPSYGTTFRSSAGYNSSPIRLHPKCDAPAPRCAGLPVVYERRAAFSAAGTAHDDGGRAEGRGTDHGQDDA
jgi:hypothetical protein